MAKVFQSRKQRGPLRFASPVSDLSVAVEFRGGAFFFFLFFFLVGFGKGRVWGVEKGK